MSAEQIVLRYLMRGWAIDTADHYPGRMGITRAINTLRRSGWMIRARPVWRPCVPGSVAHLFWLEGRAHGGC